jgi:hypothetical protein
MVKTFLERQIEDKKLFVFIYTAGFSIRNAGGMRPKQRR